MAEFPEEEPYVGVVAIRKCRTIGEYQLCIVQDEQENAISVDIVSSDEAFNALAAPQHVTEAQQYEFEGVAGESYTDCKLILDSPLTLCVVIESNEDVRVYLGTRVPMVEGQDSPSEYMRLTHGMELQFYEDTQWDSIVIWENLNGSKKCKDLENARLCASYMIIKDRFEMSVTLESEEKI